MESALADLMNGRADLPEQYNHDCGCLRDCDCERAGADRLDFMLLTEVYYVI